MQFIKLIHDWTYFREMQWIEVKSNHEFFKKESNTLRRYETENYLILFFMI
jgi:hypothetical protein